MAERVYIDAELAKDSICECYITDDEKLMLIRRINRIPAADVAPVRHGRWIPAKDYSDGNEDIECSSCGEWFKSLELCGRLGEPNYCPVCGSMNKDGG